MNQFVGLENFLGLKIIRLENELSQLSDVRKWNTSRGIKYIDDHNRMHRANSNLGLQMAAEYERRVALTTEINELRFYWKDIYHSEFNRNQFHYKPKPQRPRLMNLFGSFESLIEEPNTYENKIHHMHNGKDFDSKSEMIISEIMKSLHIEQKIHVPLIFPNGQKITIDSVINIQEANTYKLHEHFGMIGKEKYNEYMLFKNRLIIQNKLIPDFDILYTYEGEEVPSTYEYLEKRIKSFINSIL